MTDHINLSNLTTRGTKVEVDVKGDFAKALAEAAGGGSAVPTPAQAMAIEQTRLLKAFRDAEGRDPNPGDGEYWEAYGSILKMRSGRNLDDPEATPLRKAEVTNEKKLKFVDQKFRKELEDGPSWRRVVLERNGYSL